MALVVIGAGAAPHANHLTLDIPERQVLLRMDDTPQRYWHHLLMMRVSGSQWITCDPDGTVIVEDLGPEEIVPLTRASVFPVAGRPYLAFREQTEAEMAAIRARALALAEVHGVAIPAPTAITSVMWVFADPSHPMFGHEVPAALVADGQSTRVGGSVGVVNYDAEDSRGAEWTHMERITRSDLQKWIAEKREGSGRDPRLSALREPVSVIARATFREALAGCNQTSKLKTNGLFDGPLAWPELAAGITRSGLEPQAFIANYMHTSGINPRSALAVEFQYLIYSLWVFTVVDRLDPYQNSTVEHLARRALQIQKAIKRSPKSPDFDGLGDYMRHAADASQALQTPEFDKHVAEKQKQDSWIMKNQRLQREESEMVEKARRGRKGGKNDGPKEEPG